MFLFSLFPFLFSLFSFPLSFPLSFPALCPFLSSFFFFFFSLLFLLPLPHRSPCAEQLARDLCSSLPLNFLQWMFCNAGRSQGGKFFSFFSEEAENRSLFSVESIWHWSKSPLTFWHGWRTAVQKKPFHVLWDQFSIFTTTTERVMLKKYVNIIIVFSAKQVIRGRTFVYITAYDFDTTWLCL